MGMIRINSPPFGHGPIDLSIRAFCRALLQRGTYSHTPTVVAETGRSAFPLSRPDTFFLSILLKVHSNGGTINCQCPFSFPQTF